MVDLHRLATRFKSLYLSVVFKQLLGNDGIYVIEEDWDNLLILDACRYDMFAEAVGQEVDRRTSRGSTTKEFLEENFAGEQYDDTVYVTANPWVSVKVEDSFHDVIPVWESGWDDGLNTVPPSAVTRVALKAARVYPNKRLIVHFMQPHYPFIGESELIYEGYETNPEKLSADDFTGNHNPWTDVKRGVLDVEELYKAYYDNLIAVLPYATTLGDRLDGLSVISSDHGNGLGERHFPLVPQRVYSHPPMLYIPELVEVPWLEQYTDPADRKSITVEVTERHRERRAALTVTESNDL